MYIKAELYVRSLDNGHYEKFNIENVGVCGLSLNLEQFAEDYELLEVQFTVGQDKEAPKDL